MTVDSVRTWKLFCSEQFLISVLWWSRFVCREGEKCCQIWGEGTVRSPVGFILLIPPSSTQTRSKLTFTKWVANWGRRTTSQQTASFINLCTWLVCEYTPPLENKSPVNRVKGLGLAYHNVVQHLEFANAWMQFMDLPYVWLKCDNKNVLVSQR